MSARTSSIQQFPLICDRKRDELLSHGSFGDDAVAAATAYRAAGIGYQDHPEMDIVFIGAESLETIKVTHSTYFTGSAVHPLDEIHAGAS